MEKFRRHLAGIDDNRFLKAQTEGSTMRVLDHSIKQVAEYSWIQEFEGKQSRVKAAETATRWTIWITSLRSPSSRPL
jgi:hypothetical protein